MTKGTTTRSVVIEREMPYPPEKIWRALTVGSLMKEWLMENDFQPVVGHEFTFRATPVPNWNGIIESKVLAVDPDKGLAYTWGSMGMVTVVIFTLTPTATGTLVRMEQTGFGTDQDAAYKGATYGWQRFMGSLERVVGGIE